MAYSQETTSFTFPDPYELGEDDTNMLEFFTNPSPPTVPKEKNVKDEPISKRKKTNPLFEDHVSEIKNTLKNNDAIITPNNDADNEWSDKKHHMSAKLYKK